MPSYHPLDSLSAAEISLASSVFRTELFRSGIRSAKSLYVTLIERKSILPPIPSSNLTPTSLSSSQA